MKVSWKQGVLALCVVIILTLFAGVMVSFAQEQPEKKPCDGKFLGPRRSGLEKLDLKPEQIERLKKIRQRFREEREGIIQQMRERRSRVVEMLMEEEPDRKKIESAIDEILKLEGKRQKTLLDEYFEVRRNLQPEQRKLFTRKMIMSIIRER